MKLMRVLTIASLLGYSIWSLAESVTFPVKGMHCDGCVKTVTSGVCDRLKAEVKSCQVRLVDPTAEKGEIKIETLAGKKIESKRISDLLEDSGYHLAGADAKKAAAVTNH